MNYDSNLERLFSLKRFSDINTQENNVKDLYRLIKKYLNTETLMVEIGSFRGVSSELFAIHVKHIYCVDPYEIYREMGPEIKDAEYQFDNMLKNYNNITKLKQTSKEAALSNYFSDSSLDFVYIDGAHDYHSVCSDIQLWLPKIKQNGLIGGHDIEQRQVLKAINDCGLKIVEIFQEQSWICYKKST